MPKEVQVELLKEHSEHILLSYWTLYRKAEMKLMLESLDAVDTAILALEKLQKDTRVKENRESSYCELLAKCYIMRRDLTKALKFFSEAFTKCNDNNIKQSFKLK